MVPVFEPIEVRLGYKWGIVTKDVEFVTEEQLKFKKMIGLSIETILNKLLNL